MNLNSCLTVTTAPLTRSSSSNSSIIISGDVQRGGQGDPGPRGRALPPHGAVGAGGRLRSLRHLRTWRAAEDYPHGTWLGDEWNVELRVRCPIAPGDLLHVTAACRTPEKMALTLLDHLFHREVQATSNLSGHGHHGKKQLDRLMVYGIRCELRRWWWCVSGVGGVGGWWW
ncbi:protein BANP-like [Lampetra planeri]